MAEARPVTRMGISARLLLLILVAALPVLVLYAWSQYAQRQEVLDSAQDEVLRSARLLSAQHDQFFLRARSVLTIAVLAATNVGISDGACSRLLRSVTDRNRAYDSLAVAGMDGTVACATEAGLIGTNLADQSFFDQAVNSGLFTVGPRSPGPLDDAYVELALPQADASGAVEAIGITDLQLRELADVIGAASLPEGAVAYVFNAGGDVLARTPPEVASETATPITAEVAIAGGGEGVIEAPDEAGVRRLWAVVALLPEQDLYVAVGVPLTSILSGVDQSFSGELTVLALVFLLAAVSAWLTGEFIIRRPVEALNRAVTGLRGGDLSVRQEVKSSTRELHQLADNFNEMAKALERRESELSETNARLNQLIIDKDTLVREMNHRVKNSLQLVSSLIGLQMVGVSNVDARATLTAAQGRVAAVGKVHERLYAGARLDRVDMHTYLTDLCHDLGETLGFRDRGHQLTVKADVVELSPDKAIPLGLIASELITNAIKHAPADRPGHTDVVFRLADGNLTLTVTDNGRGLPEGVDPATLPGLGLKVVRSLVRQLDATLKIEPQAGGTRFEIRFSA